jgi:hypothetical protein
MTPFEAYQAFVAMKRHFTPGSTYDYVKYKGKISASAKSFNQRPDRFWYEKLARKRDVVGFLIANLSVNPKLWIKELFTDEAEQRHDRWCRVTESITYHVRQQMSQFDPWDSFDSLFTFTDGEHPKALQALMDGSLSPEVLAVIDGMCGFTKHWEKYSWDPSVRLAVGLIRKLQPFVEFDPGMVKSVLTKIFIRESREEATAA